ncbi:hypothetical protein BDF22DRAFT_775076 [Syncephalis plumigaleata]|nr:hypothetical protein BDF22DRAFT_775076 [Syncephalis plumigaleata]
MKRQMLYSLGSIAISLLINGCSADIASSAGKDTGQGLNILAASVYSGQSHITPVLEICKELVTRSHHITLVTNIPQTNWKHDNVTHIEYGMKMEERFPQLASNLKNIDHFDNDEHMSDLNNLLYEQYTPEMQFFRQLLDSIDVDVAICDFFTLACIDAAYERNIPHVTITSTVELGQVKRPWYMPHILGKFGATMEHASYWERFLNEVYVPIKFSKAQGEWRRAIPWATGRFIKGMIIVHTFEGFEPPRTLPPNILYAGPLLAEKYDPLPFELESFMNTDQNRLRWFGSITALPDTHYKLLICTLSAAHQQNLIDGVIIGLMLTDPKQLSTIVRCHSSEDSQSNIVEHNLNDMLNGKHSFIRAFKRAPQRATLEHPSVKAFISHCGLTSMHDTMHAGKPALCIPGFGDQIMNAYRIKYHGAGERLFWWEASTEMIIEKLTRIMQGDTASSARLAMERLGKMARLASRRVPMAADMMNLLPYLVHSQC